MSNLSEQRRLAAIMFTDMVGYSALSQRDDKLAQELLEEHRRLLREIFPRFHGTEIKTIGDAFLVEFGSALAAAQCAIEIQRTMAKRNHDVTTDRRIELKIGIHIGDVVHRDGDVYGDGVNIASRIEQLADAGGICVSMDVERQIRNALEARFEKIGVEEHQTADGIIPDRVAVGDGNKSRTWRNAEPFKKVFTSRNRRGRRACWFAFCMVVHASLEPEQPAGGDRAGQCVARISAKCTKFKVRRRARVRQSQR